MEDFLVELYKLLDQYGASISVDVDISDWYGVGDSAVLIRLGNEEVKVADNEWGLDATDLKAYLDANVMQSQTLGENLDESHE